MTLQKASINICVFYIKAPQMSKIPRSSLLLSVDLQLSAYLSRKLCRHLQRRFLHIAPTGPSLAGSDMGEEHPEVQSQTQMRFRRCTQRPPPPNAEDPLLLVQQVSAPSQLWDVIGGAPGKVGHQGSSQRTQQEQGSTHGVPSLCTLLQPHKQAAWGWGALGSAVPCATLQWQGVWVSPPQPWSFLHLWRLQTCPSRTRFLTLGETLGPGDESCSCKAELWPEDDARFLLLMCKRMAAIKACPSFSTHVGFPPAQPQHALIRLRITPHPRHFPGIVQHLTMSHASTRCWKLLHCSTAPAAAGLALHSAHTSRNTDTRPGHAKSVTGTLLQIYQMCSFNYTSQTLGINKGAANWESDTKGWAPWTCPLGDHTKEIYEVLVSHFEHYC